MSRATPNIATLMTLGPADLSRTSPATGVATRVLAVREGGLSGTEIRWWNGRQHGKSRYNAEVIAAHKRAGWTAKEVCPGVTVLIPPGR